MFEFIKKSPKPLIIFYASLVSMSIFAVSVLAFDMFSDMYEAIVSALALTLVAVPFHWFGKKHKALYFASIVLNNIACAFSVLSYYKYIDSKLDILTVLIAMAVPLSIVFVAFSMMQFMKVSKKATLVVTGVINTLVSIALVVLWIMYGGNVVSLALFASILSVLNLCVIGVAVDHDDRYVLRDISFGSFGAFIIITVLVLTIISEGDLIDGSELFDIGPVKDKKKIKAK